MTNLNKKKGYLAWLHYEVGKQATMLEIAHNYKLKDGSVGFSKWKAYIEAEDWEIEKATHRSILKNEIVLDIDRNTKEEAREHFNKIIGFLEKKGDFVYRAFDTGSKGFHIHIYDNKLFIIENRELDLVDYLRRFKCDVHKSNKRVMIALEFAPHWKTGVKKSFIGGSFENERRF